MIINPFLYKIELWQGGVKIDDVSNVLSLSISKAQNTVGTMSFSLYVESDFFVKYVYNTMVVVYRRSMVYGIPPYIEFAGHIVDIDPIEDDNIAPIATVLCQDFNGLLLRRKVMYYQGSPYTTKTGLAEDLVKQFVVENLGDYANSPNRFCNGRLEYLAIEPNIGRGMYMEGEDKSGQSLFDVVKDLCESSQLKFNIVGTTDNHYYFYLQSRRNGLDMSVTGIKEDGTNDAGNVPVRFNFGVGNISKVTRKILNSNRLTTVVAFGQGTDEDREVCPISRPTESGLEMREEVVNATNEDELGLNFVAWRRFNTPPVDSFAMEIVQVPGFIYGYNYKVGDLVTLEYQGSQKHLVINSASVSIESDGNETVQLELLEEI